MKIEHITEQELLRAYLQTNYSQAALVFDALPDTENETYQNLLDQLAETGFLPPAAMRVFGWIIIEMPAEMAITFCNKFPKAGFPIYAYLNGEIIAENY